MSESTKPAATETNSNEEKQQDTVATEVEAQTAEENKEADRPGVCCGSCS